ncbi:zinc ribbon domain-containing protein [Streptomyces sp. SA15]|uniref:zinc ribbon domain-containing protein n=1 Tax=Streptomyces sp. SA15 TaxID=934019 RepID=UPI00359C817C
MRGLLHCGICGRRMQGQRSRDVLYYRCRFPNEYALANKITHPRNVYLAEQDLITPLDTWLARAFAPHRLHDTITRMHAAQPDSIPAPEAEDALRVVAECDAKIAQWTAETQARRTQALAQTRTPTSEHRLSKEDIHAMIQITRQHPRRARRRRTTGQGRRLPEPRSPAHLRPRKTARAGRGSARPAQVGNTVCVRGGT